MTGEYNDRKRFQQQAGLAGGYYTGGNPDFPTTGMAFTLNLTIREASEHVSPSPLFTEKLDEEKKKKEPPSLSFEG